MGKNVAGEMGRIFGGMSSTKPDTGIKGGSGEKTRTEQCRFKCPGESKTKRCFHFLTISFDSRGKNTDLRGGEKEWLGTSLREMPADCIRVIGSQ